MPPTDEDWTLDRTRSAAERGVDLLRRSSQDLDVKLVQLARMIASRHRELDLPLAADARKCEGLEGFVG